MQGIKRTFRLNKGVRLNSYFCNCSYQNVKLLSWFWRHRPWYTTTHTCGGWDCKWVVTQGAVAQFINTDCFSRFNCVRGRLLCGHPSGAGVGPGWGLHGRMVSSQRYPRWNTQRNLSGEWDFQRKIPYDFLSLRSRNYFGKKYCLIKSFGNRYSFSVGREISLNY